MNIDKDKFWKNYRVTFGKVTQKQVDAVEFLLDKADVNVKLYLPYILATVKHETADTYEPIDEYGSAVYFDRRYGPDTRVGKALGNTCKGDGALYHGRGYVQLTGRRNYKLAEDKLKHPLVSQPELAKNRDVAYETMIHGMLGGWFTGKKLSDYIYMGRSDYTNARRIINGTDKAAIVAGYARGFEGCL